LSSRDDFPDFVASFSIRVVGKTPAFKLFLSRACDLKVNEKPVKVSVPGGIAFLISSVTIEQTIPETMTCSPDEPLPGGMVKAKFFGRVDFDDVFGKHHRLPFCLLAVKRPDFFNGGKPVLGGRLDDCELSLEDLINLSPVSPPPPI